MEALKALLPRYEGSVKCIYIDLPNYMVFKMENSRPKGMVSMSKLAEIVGHCKERWAH